MSISAAASVSKAFGPNAPLTTACAPCLAMNCEACTPAPPEADNAGFSNASHSPVSVSTMQKAAARPKRASNCELSELPEIEIAIFIVVKFLSRRE